MSEETKDKEEQRGGAGQLLPGNQKKHKKKKQVLTAPLRPRQDEPIKEFQTWPEYAVEVRVE